MQIQAQIHRLCPINIRHSSKSSTQTQNRQLARRELSEKGTMEFQVVMG